MPDAIRELVAVVSPVVAESADKSSQMLKGFVSVETIDRSKDLVSPEEFNVDQFMAAPTMMVNHRFWRDKQGNEISIGVPTLLRIAKLAINKSDNTVWDIVDIKTKDVISSFPKQKVPNLKRGDRGLFIIAKVTNAEVWGMVDRGELSAFSWRGLVEVGFKATTEGVQRVLKNIDLFEISLVHMPDNPDATFSIGKSVNESMPILAHIHLQKTRFETETQATEWLKDHKLESHTIVENDTEYVARQNRGDFNPATYIRAKMNDGIYFVCGDLKPEALTEHQPWLTQVVGEDVVKEMSDLWKPSEKLEDTMTTKTEEKTEDMTTKTEEKTTETSTETPTEIVAEEKTEAEKASEVLVQQVSAGVAETLKPTLEAVAEGQKAIAAVLEKFSPEVKELEEKTETATEEKIEEAKTEVETEEKTEEVVEGNSLADIQKTLGNLGTALLSLNTKIETVAKATPNGTVREEKVVEEKTTETSPNSVFNGLWPMI